MADVKKIEALLELGWSYRRIARELGCRRETVSRYDRLAKSKPAKVIAGSRELQNRPNPIAGSELNSAVVAISGRRSMAVPYHGEIAAGLARGLSAQRIWQDLVEEQGYAHGPLTVRRYVRHVKGRRPEVADVMEHPPGEEGQVDFFKSPALVLDPASGKWRRPWVLGMTLSCSRHLYAEATWTQDRIGFMRLHEHAFSCFQGVPRILRHDNLGAAVVRACLYDPDGSEVYEAFARYWGFTSLPSRPRHPQEQGVEERTGGYIKGNALKGRRFDSLEEHNAYLEKWNRTVAQLRIHGTTRRQVISHFQEVEQPALRPLPDTPFEIFEVSNRTVHPDGFIEVEGQFYAVPQHLLHEVVRVRWDEHLIRVYYGGREVRVHLRRHGAVGFWSDPSDRPKHKPARQQAYQENLLARAERVGARTLAWAKAAIEERDVRAYRLLQGVLALTRQHPKEAVDWACGVALESRAFRHRTLRRLVENAVARTPAVRRQLTQDHELIRPTAEYAQIALFDVTK